MIGTRWHVTLTKAQQNAVNAALAKVRPHEHKKAGGEGWSVFMLPSTGPPLYIELRYRDGHGRLTRTVPVWDDERPWIEYRDRWLTPSGTTAMYRGVRRGTITRVA